MMQKHPTLKDLYGYAEDQKGVKKAEKSAPKK
jgi:hypothetical protein